MLQEDKDNLLVRIDERMSSLCERFEHLESIIELLNKHSLTREEFMKHTEQDEKMFVTKSEFQPIKNIVYGMVGSVLLAFLGAVVTLILR